MSETNIVATYLSIADKMRKRMFRKTPTQTVITQYQELAATLQRSGQTNYMALCLLAAARCEEAVQNSPTSPIPELYVTAARAFASSGIEDSQMMYFSADELLTQAITCYTTAINLYEAGNRPSICANLYFELAESLKHVSKFEDSAIFFLECAKMLERATLLPSSSVPSATATTTANTTNTDVSKTKGSDTDAMHSHTKVSVLYTTALRNAVECYLHSGDLESSIGVLKRLTVSLAETVYSLDTAQLQSSALKLQHNDHSVKQSDDESSPYEVVQSYIILLTEYKTTGQYHFELVITRLLLVLLFLVMKNRGSATEVLHQIERQIRNYSSTQALCRQQQQQANPSLRFPARKPMAPLHEDSVRVNHNDATIHAKHEPRLFHYLREHILPALKLILDCCAENDVLSLDYLLQQLQLLLNPISHPIHQPTAAALKLTGFFPLVVSRLQQAYIQPMYLPPLDPKS